jgi:hypothetical protein
MVSRKNNRSRQEWSDAKSMRAIYAEFRKNFTAADLQKYTVIEKGYPLGDLIADMEAIHNKVTRGKK